MFDMDLPWWEFIVRGVAVYASLLVMVRLSGRRTVGQFTPFDLLVVMLLSEAVSNSLSGGDDSLIGGLIIAATLLLLNMLVALLSARSKRMSAVLDGTAVLLGRDGTFFDNVVKRCRIAIPGSNWCAGMAMASGYANADCIVANSFGRRLAIPVGR
jgi:uncharacterized membrane protein YcaP (DUF421 family)